MLNDHRFRTSKLGRGDERGQTLVEYALILLFVSTALVVTLGGLTSEISTTLENVVAGF
jgi:Flp pilus assembly pilin Flp